MKLTMRKYQRDEDQQKIRKFLQDVFLKNRRRETCWPLYRWDYWCWHVNKNIFKFNLEAAVFLWETEDHQLAAILHPDAAGEAFLQVHPDYRSPELEVDMMKVAETQFATTQANGEQRLVLWAHETDDMRQDILFRRGYTQHGNPEFQRRRPMDRSIPEFNLPEGYTIRELEGEDEHPARSWVSWKAFHPSEPDQNHQGFDWYKNVQKAPMYRQDLDLVAVAPNGEFAAFCTIWMDFDTATASFEPVGTHPDHQRKGLGKALMAEGLSRVSKLGATLCTVGSYSEPADTLYASLGFTAYDLNEPWVKEW